MKLFLKDQIFYIFKISHFYIVNHVFIMPATCLLWRVILRRSKAYYDTMTRCGKDYVIHLGSHKDLSWNIYVNQPKGCENRRYTPFNACFCGDMCILSSSPAPGLHSSSHVMTRLFAHYTVLGLLVLWSINNSKCIS